MIEPTDVMQRVAQDAYESGESWRSVVIAVLAIVERDRESEDCADRIATETLGDDE